MFIHNLRYLAGFQMFCLCVVCIMKTYFVSLLVHEISSYTKVYCISICIMVLKISYLFYIMEANFTIALKKLKISSCSIVSVYPDTWPHLIINRVYK